MRLDGKSPEPRSPIRSPTPKRGRGDAGGEQERGAAAPARQARRAPRLARAPRRGAARARAAARPRSAGRARAGAARAPRRAVVADEVEEIRLALIPAPPSSCSGEAAQAAARACLHGTERDRRGSPRSRSATARSSRRARARCAPSRAAPPSPGARGRRPRTARRARAGRPRRTPCRAARPAARCGRGARGRRSRSARPRTARVRPARARACSSGRRARPTRTPPGRVLGLAAVAEPPQREAEHRSSVALVEVAERVAVAAPRRARAAPRRSARARTPAASSRLRREKGKRVGIGDGIAIVLATRFGAARIRLFSMRPRARSRGKEPMTALAFNSEQIAAQGAEAEPARARRHLPRDRRGALQALPGVREQAERDPRQARRGRSLDREPGLLRHPRAEGRPDLRDRRDQEPRDLLRAPRRARRRPRRRDRRPRQARLRLGRRLARAT